MLKRLLLIYVIVFCIVGVVSFAVASEITEFLNDTDSFYEKGEYNKAIESLKKAIDLAWEKGPLTLNNVCFVTKDPEGFGLYEPKSDNIFDGKETIRVYAEPSNYTIRRGPELNEFFLKLDLYLLDAENNIIWGKEDFIAKHIYSRTINREFMLYPYIVFTKGALSSGVYKIKLSVKDGLSEKMATVVKEFEVR